MADEFQLGSGNWWDSTRTNTRYDDGGTTTPATAATSSTPLSSMGSNNYGWQTDIMDIKTRSSMEPAASVSGGASNSMAFTDLQESSGGAAAAAAGLLPDPSLQMMGLGLSSHNMDWNQTLFRGAGKAEGSFRMMLQEEGTNTNYQQQDDQWRQKLFGESPDDHDSSSMNDYKQIGRGGGLSLDQPHEYSSHGSSNNSPITCQQANLNNNFQVDSSSDYHTNQNHMLQAGFLLSENHHHHQQQQQQSFDSQSPMTNYGLYPSSYASMHNNNNINPNSNQLNTTSWSKFPQFLRPSPPKQTPPPQGQLQFSNNAPFWNASSTTTVNDSSRSGLFPTIQSTQLPPPPNFQEKSKNTSEVRDSAGTSKKNNSSEASSKRARQETAPAMPAFKVRKEKMGDRITALQQLVSPFGKTDTASVLSEAIEYIKFLHEQVSVLSTPYMKNGAPLHHQQKDPEGLRQDLRSRGLCLVPVSSTFPVTHESTVDYWTPTFGGTFR